MKLRGLVCAAIGTALLCIAPPAWATFPGGNGRIAFQRDVDPTEEVNYDVFTMEPDGSDVRQLTTDPASDVHPAWSYDGTRIAFASTRAGPGWDIYVMNADGSNVTRLTHDPKSAHFPTWSPDGQWIAFLSHRDTPPGDLCVTCHPDVYKVRTDGSQETGLTSGAAGGVPDWSPSGDRIAFTPTNPGLSGIHTMRADGTDLREITPVRGHGPRWAPEGHEIVFDTPDDRLYRVPSSGGTARQISIPHPASLPLFSPNGGRILYRNFNDELILANPDGSNRTQIGTGSPWSWQRLPQPPYLRPRGAGPYRASLVPGQRACANPNREHGPPLAFPSCNPPSAVSDYVTVGTPDANGSPAASTGSVHLRPLRGDPATGTDEADVAVSAAATDVRCTDSALACTAGPLSSYTGDLRVALRLRLTDEYVNDLPATSEGEISVPMPCVPGAAGEGSACSVATTVDAVVPGAVREQNRALWELVRIEVWDGGQDGSLMTRDDDSLFATQGVFVP